MQPFVVGPPITSPFPFFNMFSTVDIEAFPENEARELIASSPIIFAPPDVDWIITQSQGWPLLVQNFCQVRLSAFDEGDNDLDWQAEGVHQLAPFSSLLAEVK